jgi:hypothetical protein
LADVNAKPALQDILMECHKAIEALIRGHIHASLMSKGMHKAAELPKVMVSASVKLLRLLLDYGLHDHHLSQVGQQALGFSSSRCLVIDNAEVVQDIFVYISQQSVHLSSQTSCCSHIYNV